MSVGLIASCASWALLLLVKMFGFCGTYSAPNFARMSCLTPPTASPEMRTESVLM